MQNDEYIPEYNPSEGLVTYRGALDMQVCVPSSWTDQQIKHFADTFNEAGTMNGWQVRTDPRLLGGDPVRSPCKDAPEVRVHVMLDA